MVGEGLRVYGEVYGERWSMNAPDSEVKAYTVKNIYTFHSFFQRDEAPLDFCKHTLRYHTKPCTKTRYFYKKNWSETCSPTARGNPTGNHLPKVGQAQAPGQQREADRSRLSRRVWGRSSADGGSTAAFSGNMGS